MGRGRRHDSRTLFGVRYPDGSVLQLSSKPAARSHVKAANEHAARRAKERPGAPAPGRLVVVTCEQTPWVELED